MSREHKQQIDEMKKLITEKLLDNLRNSEKAPRASMIGTAISWVKAVDPSLGTGSIDELRDSMQRIGESLVTESEAGEAETVNVNGFVFKSRIQPTRDEDIPGFTRRIRVGGAQ